MYLVILPADRLAPHIGMEDFSGKQFTLASHLCWFFFILCLGFIQDGALKLCDSFPDQDNLLEEIFPDLFFFQDAMTPPRLLNRLSSLRLLLAFLDCFG